MFKYLCKSQSGPKWGYTVRVLGTSGKVPSYVEGRAGQSKKAFFKPRNHEAPEASQDLQKTR